MARTPSTEDVYEGDGVTAVFQFHFPFLYASDVFVSVDGVNVSFTILPGSIAQVQTTVPPAAGTVVKVYRSTLAYVPEHLFARGVPFLPRYVDENNRQLLYAAQEAINDTAVTAAKALVVAEEAKEIAERAESKIDGAIIDSSYQLRLDLANISDPAKGAHLVAYEGRPLDEWLDGSPVQVKLPTGTSDSAVDLAAALAVSNRVVLPPSPLPYVFKTPLTATLLSDTQIDFNGQLCQFDGGRVSLKAATVASGRTLNANADRYAFQVSLADASGIQAGDILFINTSIAPSTDWSDTKKDCVTVKGVTGNLVDLFEPLNFHYTTTDAGLSITVYRAKQLKLKDPNFLLIAADGDTTGKVMLDIYGMRGVEIISPTIKGQRPFTRDTNIYRVGIQLLACIDTTVRNTKSEAMSYPIGAYFASRGIQELQTEGKYNHHTNIDCGDWSSDYSLDGMVSSDCYQSLNTHPVIRAYARNFQVSNDYGLSNWRCVGGGLRDGVINSLVGDAAEIAQYQNAPMTAAYQYLYSDADLYFNNVDFRVPNRITKAPVAVRFGRNVSVSNCKMSDLWVSYAARGDVATLTLGAGNRFGTTNWARTPKKDNIRTVTRVDTNCPLDAELISGVYHVNPRATLVPHSKGRLRCEGSILTNLTQAAQLAVPVRIHVNAFTDAEQAEVVLGKLKLFATALSPENTGVFSTLEKHFNFEFNVRATTTVQAPTTAVYTSGLSGQANENITLTIGAPNFAGVSQIGGWVDHYIEFPVNISTTRPYSITYSLTYELELIRAL